MGEAGGRHDRQRPVVDVLDAVLFEQFVREFAKGALPAVRCSWGGFGRHIRLLGSAWLWLEYHME